jgi:hypothetical protein
MTRVTKDGSRRRLAGCILLAATAIGCGDSERVTRDPAADAGRATDGGAAGDAGTRDGGTAARDGGSLCGDVLCAAGTLCCQVSCEGTLGCTAPEGTECPLLGCPPRPRTPCGDTECDTQTEICLEGNFGGPTRIDCRPVPSGCEAEESRTCACLASAYCNTPMAECTEVSANHIFCETGFD